MIRLAAESGMFGALVGFEAYDEKILKGVGKIGSREINERAAEIFRRNKIVIFGVHMFNIPGQNSKDYFLTYKHGSKNSDIFRLSMFSPLPGTPIFEKYKREGKIKQYDSRNYPYAYCVVDKDMNSKRVKILYYWYFFKHYFNPRTLLSIFFCRNRLLRRMKIQAYIQNLRYVMYLFFRKIGIKIL
jgi:radical SAM superfamily enzyme YgiQ (UPF0313 family)